MGLDMYLDGEKYLWAHSQNPDDIPREDGFQVKSRTLRLGYWRKHPNLHGYIVQNFADGIDNCQPIDLQEEDIEKIFDAVARGDLPHTEGFFFGASDGSEKEEDIHILKAALLWLRIDEPNAFRSIRYRASW
jgi:hypothetical protein